MSEKENELRGILLETDNDELAGRLRDFIQEDGERLPLEEPCDRGGFPDPETIEVGTVTVVNRGEEKIVARCMVYFEEQVNTSCGDVVLGFAKDIDLEMTIDLEMAEYDYKALDSHSYDDEPEPEF